MPLDQLNKQTKNTHAHIKTAEVHKFAMYTPDF